MVTIKEVKREIEDIEKEINDGVLPRIEKKLRKKIPFFRACILYLEKEPSEDYLKTELGKLKQKVAKIMERFSGVSSKEKTLFKKEYGVDKMEGHVKSIQYILS